MFTGLCQVDSDTLLASTFGGQVFAYSLSREQRTLALKTRHANSG
jgi:acyl-CoA thioesterase